MYFPHLFLSWPFCGMFSRLWISWRFGGELFSLIAPLYCFMMWSPTSLEPGQQWEHKSPSNDENLMKLRLRPRRYFVLALSVLVDTRWKGCTIIPNCLFFFCELCSLMMPIRPHKYFAVDAAEQQNHFVSRWFKKKVSENKMWGVRIPASGKTSVLIGHSWRMLNSRETTRRRAIGRRGWSRRTSRGAGAGGRTAIRRPLLPGHLCSWRNGPASLCHTTLSTGRDAD